MLTDKEINHFSTELPEGVKIVDIREKGSDVKDFNVWSFVERYYPNYSSCDEIAKHSDLEKVVNDQWDFHDDAHKLHLEIKSDIESDTRALSFDNDYYQAPEHLIIDEAKRRITELESKIYQKAIEGFIEFMKGGQ